MSFKSSEISVAAIRLFLAVDGVQGAAFANLQPQVIDGGLSKTLDLGCQTGSAPNWDRLIGPIG